MAKVTLEQKQKESENYGAGDLVIDTDTDEVYLVCLTSINEYNLFSFDGRRYYASSDSITGLIESMKKSGCFVKLNKGSRVTMEQE